MFDSIIFQVITIFIIIAYLGSFFRIRNNIIEDQLVESRENAEKEKLKSQYLNEIIHSAIEAKIKDKFEQLRKDNLVVVSDFDNKIISVEKKPRIRIIQKNELKDEFIYEQIRKDKEIKVTGQFDYPDFPDSITNHWRNYNERTNTQSTEAYSRNN